MFDPLAYPISISIHTPIKGVTSEQLQLWGRWTDFNPHTHKGCDRPDPACDFSNIVISIHTPIKGVTSARLFHLHRHLISIHTPIKGVTIIHPYEYSGENISIHTPIKGVTIEMQ